MTHKRKQKRLQRLERLIKDTNLLEHWARGLWMRHTWIYSGHDEPEADDNSGCPFEKRQSSMSYYVGSNRIELLAPFCSIRGVSYETDCGTEYDAECDGCSKDCWLLFLKWHLRMEIEFLEAVVRGA